MKIRIMGRKEECELAMAYYCGLEKEDYVKSVQVSQYYPNRGSNTVYRLYVDIEYRDSHFSSALIKN